MKIPPDDRRGSDRGSASGGSSNRPRLEWLPSPQSLMSSLADEGCLDSRGLAMMHRCSWDSLSRSLDRTCLRAALNVW